jgi:hypothetical protein
LKSTGVQGRLHLRGFARWGGRRDRGGERKREGGREGGREGERESERAREREREEKGREAGRERERERARERERERERAEEREREGETCTCKQRSPLFKKPVYYYTGVLTTMCPHYYVCVLTTNLHLRAVQPARERERGRGRER